MACVTLKRPVEMLGSTHMLENEPTLKRRRCGSSLFPTTPPGTRSGLQGASGGGSSSAGLYRYHGVCGSPLSLNQSTKRAKRKLMDDDEPYSTPSNSPPVSPFLSATPPIETDKIVAQLGQQLKRLQRRNDPSLQQQQQPIGSPASSSKDQPLFTLKQVTLVCQRMMKEREELVRSQYDKILAKKLAEQYDTFVKFTHDQVEKRLAESAFSYVS